MNWNRFGPIPAVALSLILLPTGAGSQERICMPPEYTVETFEQHLLEMGAGGNQTGIMQITEAALEPRAPPACRGRLPEEEDLQEVMIDLIYLVADQDVPALSIGFFDAIRIMLRGDEAEGWEQRTLPMEAMAYAVERGRAVETRRKALYALLGLAYKPEVEAYLLRWARAPVGPPARPDLPQSIVNDLYFSLRDEHSSLREALESDASLVRNPRACCLVENRGPVRGIDDPPPARTGGSDATPTGRCPPG